MPRWALGIGCLLLAGCAPPQAVAPRAAASHHPVSAEPSGSAEVAPGGALLGDGAEHFPDDGEPDDGDPEDAHAEGEHDEGEHDEVLDDGLDDALGVQQPATAPRSPLSAMSDAEIERLLRDDPAALGSLSLGATNAGRLFNGVQMPEGEGWKNISPAYAWGTQETVDYLIKAIQEARRRHPDSPPLYLGHISAKHGGPLSPHRSHQSGRDLDISYYLTPQRAGFHRAGAQNLDRERTWAFVRALITETDVEMILIDTSVQRLLKEHALKIGEDREWVDGIFQVGSRNLRPMIRHARGHANHIHVRFYNPIAQASAARAHALLVKQGKLPGASAAAAAAAAVPPAGYIQHKVRNGQTLGILAKRYGVSVEAIQRANNLKGTFVKAKRVLNIPRAGAPVRGAPARGAAAPSRPPMLKPPVIPPRRLPPGRSAQAVSAAGPALDG